MLWTVSCLSNSKEHLLSLLRIVQCLPLLSAYKLLIHCLPPLQSFEIFLPPYPSQIRSHRSYPKSRLQRSLGAAVGGSLKQQLRRQPFHCSLSYQVFIETANGQACNRIGPLPEHVIAKSGQSESLVEVENHQWRSEGDFVLSHETGLDTTHAKRVEGFLSTFTIARKGADFYVDIGVSARTCSYERE